MFSRNKIFHSTAVFLTDNAKTKLPLANGYVPNVLLTMVNTGSFVTV